MTRFQITKLEERVAPTTAIAIGLAGSTAFGRHGTAATVTVTSTTTGGHFASAASASGSFAHS